MGRSKSRFTLMEKEEIVRVAFSTPNNVKATARLYGIHPQNIRYWSKSLLEARSALSPSTFKKSKSRVSLSQGKSAKHYECDDALFEFMQNLHQQQRKVTVRLMCAEYKRLNEDDGEVSNHVIRRRIYRWMRRKNVANFDETNLDFNVDGGQTLISKGAKTIGVKGAS